MLKDNVFLGNEAAKRLYRYARDLPIVDYHCHLSPKEIAEDKVFSDIGELWLAGDHYKWRLMRQFGIDEELITGNASYHDKFIAYASCVSLAAGNPLFHWTTAELSAYFGIHTLLNEITAEEIWEKANKVIKKEQLSPRKLIQKSKVAYIATTDDPADTLDFHHAISADKSFYTKVAPTFRTDNPLSIRSVDYMEYIKKLSAASGVAVRNLASFEEALKARLNDFCGCGCRFADIGIEFFPRGACGKAEAEEIFSDALIGKEISDGAYRRFLTYAYLFLAGEYKERGITMQLHTAVKRNASSALLNSIGKDCGGDCMNDALLIEDVISLFDRLNDENILPSTILYTLNPENAAALATVCGTFKGVSLGAAWWFNDHKGGIIEQLEIVSQTSHLATFPGMLTDSRSFLSYTRHDYFRRIFCTYLGKMLENGEFADENAAITLVRRVCVENSQLMAGISFV